MPAMTEPKTPWMTAANTGALQLMKPVAEASAEDGTLSLTIVKEIGPMQLVKIVNSAPRTVSPVKDTAFPYAGR